MTKELVISSSRHETRVAILEDDQVVEVYHQRENEYSLAGSIHKGRVTRASRHAVGFCRHRTGARRISVCLRLLRRHRGVRQNRHQRGRYGPEAGTDSAAGSGSRAACAERNGARPEAEGSFSGRERTGPRKPHRQRKHPPADRTRRRRVTSSATGTATARAGADAEGAVKRVVDAVCPTRNSIRPGAARNLRRHRRPPKS